MLPLPITAWFALLIALPLFTLAPGAAQGAPADATRALHDWLDGQYEEELARSPETLTRLGSKARYGELDDYSAEAEAGYLDWFRDSVDAMTARFDYDALDAEGRLSWDLWQWRLERLEEALAFSDHDYVFTPVSAPHVDLPQLMINYHAVDTRADMDAYVQRLEAIGPALRQLLARAEDAAARGIRPPRFAYDIVIEQAGGVIQGYPFDDSGEPSALWADADSKVEALAQAGVIDGAEAGAVRGAAAAARSAASGEGDPEFMAAKQATAGAYMAHSLPEVSKMAAKISGGPDALSAINPDWL